MTLVELLVVLAVLIAIAGIAFGQYQGHAEQAQLDATRITLGEVRQAIVGGPGGPGYRTDVLPASGLPAAYPATIDDLFARPAGVPAFDPVRRTGWRGPYLQHAGERAVRDAWGGAVVIQKPTGPEPEATRNTRLVAPGKNGVVDASVTWLTPADLEAQKPAGFDDQVLFLEAVP